MDGWIDIVEFATKYGVSQSTLRRRIRSQTIAFKMERGKYMLEDSAEALRRAPLFSRGYASPKQRVVMRQNDEIQDALNGHLRSEVDRLGGENRKLKAQLSEYETLVKALEAQLSAK